MKRLIEHAAKIDKSVNANSMSFANIVKAIHAVQTEMGITGTTAKEAMSTIEGSINMTKAAWQNLLTGLADDNADFDKLVNDFVESASAAAENLIPRIEEALNGVAKLVSNLAPKLIAELPTLVEQLLPEVSESALKILDAFITALTNNQEELVNAGFKIITTLVNGLLNQLPLIIQFGLNFIVSLSQGITENLPQIFDTIIQVLDEIAGILTDPENLQMILDSALDLILAFAEGLMEFLPELTDATIQIIIGIVEFLLLPENITKLINAALQLIIALGEGLIKAIPELAYGLTRVVQAIFDGILKIDWEQVGGDVISEIGDGLSKSWESIKNWFRYEWKNLFSGLKYHVSASGEMHSGGGLNGSFAKGLDYVPFDGFVAELHQGERVLTKEENKTYGKGGTVFSGLTININGANYSNESELAEAIAEELQKMTERTEAIYA